MATVIIPSTTFTATATLNLFLGTRVNVNTDALGIAWVKNKQYRIELTEGFVKEVGKNISPNPGINNLTTITTNALGPQKTISSPGDNEAFVDNNRSVTVTYDRQIEVGSGNIQLYQSDNTLLATIAVPSAAVTFPTATQMRISVLGLLRANQSYYYLFDAGVVKDKDGFDSVVISSSVALNYTTSATNDIAFPFPDLSANITGAFSPIFIFGGKLKGIVANITTPSFTMSVTARKTARPVVPLTVQATTATLPRADFKLKATTINCTTALTSSIRRIRRISSVFTAQVTVPNLVVKRYGSVGNRFGLVTTTDYDPVLGRPGIVITANKNDNTFIVNPNFIGRGGLAGNSLNDLIANVNTYAIYIPNPGTTGNVNNNFNGVPYIEVSIKPNHPAFNLITNLSDGCSNNNVGFEVSKMSISFHMELIV